MALQSTRRDGSDSPIGHPEASPRSRCPVPLQLLPGQRYLMPVLSVPLERLGDGQRVLVGFLGQGHSGVNLGLRLGLLHLSLLAPKGN